VVYYNDASPIAGCRHHIDYTKLEGLYHQKTCFTEKHIIENTLI